MFDRGTPFAKRKLRNGVMTRKKIPPIRDIFRLEAEGLNGSEIDKSLDGIERSGIYHYLQRRKSFGLTWEDLKHLNDYELDKKFNKKSGPKNNKIEPDFEAIKAYFKDRKPKKGRRKFMKKEAYQVYVDMNEGEDMSMLLKSSAFNERLNKYEKKKNPTMLLEHAPSEMAFDFCGTTLRYIDEDKSIKDAVIFVSTLALSCLIFIWACRSQKKADVIDAIVRCIDFLGGVPKWWKHDNMPAAKTPEFRECVAYYEAINEPSRFYHSQDNAKAENAVGLVTRNILLPLSGKIFPSLADLNDTLQRELGVLNNRSFQDYSGSPCSRFEDEEESHLGLKPKEPFEFFEHRASQKVKESYSVKLDRHSYSVPWERIDDHVQPRVSINAVHIFYKGERIATHSRSYQPGGFTRDPSHMPPDHKGYQGKSYEEYLEWAGGYGDSTKAVIEAQFESGDLTNPNILRICGKLEDLAKANREHFEKACEYSLQVGLPKLTHLRDILDMKPFKRPKPELVHQFKLPIQENVRGSSYYSEGGL